MAGCRRCGVVPRPLRSSLGPFLLLLAVLAGLTSSLAARCRFAGGAGSVTTSGFVTPHQLQLAASWRTERANSLLYLHAAAATDTFDPWTALGISPGANAEEARQAYKKLIRK